MEGFPWELAPNKHCASPRIINSPRHGSKVSWRDETDLLGSALYTSSGSESECTAFHGGKEKVSIFVLRHCLLSLSLSLSLSLVCNDWWKQTSNFYDYRVNFQLSRKSLKYTHATWCWSTFRIPGWHNTYVIKSWSSGSSIYDVSTREGRGDGRANEVKEVTWILLYKTAQIVDKGVKKLKDCRYHVWKPHSEEAIVQLYDSHGTRTVFLYSVASLSDWGEQSVTGVCVTRMQPAQTWHVPREGKARRKMMMVRCGFYIGLGGIRKCGSKAWCSKCLNRQVHIRLWHWIFFH